MEDGEVVDLEVLAHLGGEHPEDLPVRAGAGDVRLAEGPHAALPVDEGAVLLLRWGHGQDHVGVLAHLGATYLELDHAAGSAQGRAGQTGVRKVSQVHPADHETGELAVGQGGEDGGGVPAGCLGQVGRAGGQARVAAPGGGHLGACGGVRHRASSGQEVGQETCLDATALTGAARHPGQACSGGRGQGVHHGQEAGDDGGALAHEDGGTLRLERLHQPGVGGGQEGDGARLLSRGGEDHLRVGLA